MDEKIYWIWLSGIDDMWSKKMEVLFDYFTCASEIYEANENTLLSIVDDYEKTGKKGMFNEKDIKWERFHCGGNGGQNVNKVETGMRLIHIPTGITVTSTEERSQFLNKSKALKKLAALLKEQESASQAKQTNDAWREHNRIVRGNPVRVYKGMEFARNKR